MVTSLEQLGYNLVYLYTNCRIVCNNRDYDDYSESKCDSVVYSSCANMFGSDFSGLANNI